MCIRDRSITDLFLPAMNPNSWYHKRFNILLPHIAKHACSPKTPPGERSEHFLTKVSPQSARSYLKKYCANAQRTDLYAHVLSYCPQHLPIMPSLLNKQTSLPLIAMCRSVPSNRLSNSMFTNPLRRKLRLPIFDPEDLPTCWCGKPHDCFGDHAFCLSLIHI